MLFAACEMDDAGTSVVMDATADDSNVANNSPGHVAIGYSWAIASKMNFNCIIERLNLRCIEGISS
jgi:hypothetical protein